MSLNSNPVVMIFLDTTSIERARHFFENVIGLSTVENQFHPPHHYHGLFKYDAGNAILALNLGRSVNDRAGLRDGILTILEMPDAKRRLGMAIESGLCTPVGNGAIVDRDGHCFAFIEAMPSCTVAAIHRIVYFGDPRTPLRAFFQQQLRLEPCQDDSLSFRAGRIWMSVAADDPDVGPSMCHDTYLTVFHAPDIRRTAATLLASGVPLMGAPRFTSIGGTVRFSDPAGHQFCLYQPDERCFDWGSGPKLAELIGSANASGEAP
jgi:predicted enzyme related to lactoylglutathione lyase